MKVVTERRFVVETTCVVAAALIQQFPAQHPLGGVCTFQSNWRVSLCTSQFLPKQHPTCRIGTPVGLDSSPEFHTSTLTLTIALAAVNEPRLLLKKSSPESHRIPSVGSLEWLAGWHGAGFISEPRRTCCWSKRTDGWRRLHLPTGPPSPLPWPRSASA